MKFIKPFFVLLIVIAFASCNTKNRPKVHDTVEGTPTNADTVLLKSHGENPTEKKAVPQVFRR